MRTNLDNMKNQKVLVVGLGKSGIAALQAMLKLGAKVSVQDSKSVEEVDPQLLAFLEGKDVNCYFGRDPEDMGIFDMLILSPGVSPDLAFVKRAQELGVEIIGELEIAYRIGKGSYVAITGTNGKTTTTTLVGEIFKQAKRKTYIVGNIGVAVISKSLTAEEDSWLVTETSSFQLETIRYFKPTVSAILNLTPDHLDRHKTMENYGKSKARIFENQRGGQYLVINYDDKDCFALAKDCKATVVPFSRKEVLDFGSFIQEGYLTVKDEEGREIRFCRAEELNIPGTHNLENALAAAAISYFAGIDPQDITEALTSFQGVAHRLEFCGQVDGVRFVNDSKGTNPDASIKAVEAIDGGIILIAGGYDKNASFEDLIRAFHGKVKHMVLLGQTAEKISKAAESLGFNDSIMAKNMEECVREGFKLAEPGDTVLLSPACASWDMYTDFEQRGEHFKSCVDRLGK